MMDPEQMPSSAGGFPWKADGDFRTVVYIKNETDVVRKITAFLTWPGGVYATGTKDVKPRQTIAIDFRDLRDNQTPDGMGNLIPLDLEAGQIAWSVKGSDNKVLSARSEQISVAEGMASTYSCANCCPNVITDLYVNPDEAEVEFGDMTPFDGTQYESNCYNQSFGPYAADTIEWDSYDTNIATIDSSGDSEAVGVGSTTIEGCVERTIWYNWGGGYCEPNTAVLCNNAPVESRPRISKIQYKGPNNTTFADATSTLYVLKDTEVSFKAIPSPITATFPSGKPTWSGTSGANGTGQTISVTFGSASSSSSNFKTVVATSGNSTVTVNVIVYELAKLVTPTENFENRSQTTFGLKEIIELNHTITPSGISATSIGGLRWVITSGTGTGSFLEVNDQGTAEFRAPSSPASSSLKLSVLDGPSKDRNITHSLTTVAPTASARMILATGRRHIQTKVDAGFKAYIHLDPKNVSFKYIQFSEGQCDAADSGYLDGLGTSHDAGSPQPILLCNSTTGCKVQNQDTCYMGHPSVPSPTPYAVGSWNWPIPWYYHSDGDPVEYYTANQLLESDASGNATISKGGVSVTYNVNAPSVSIDW